MSDDVHITIPPGTTITGTSDEVARIMYPSLFPKRETDPEQETPRNPIRDLCPECRAAPGQKHHPECTFSDPAIFRSDVNNGLKLNMPPGDAPDLLPIQVPYQVQEWCFERLADDAPDELRDLLLERAGAIVGMARERFRAGYLRYGSRMFGWTAEERLRNVLEELADAVVYLVSGPIE